MSKEVIGMFFPETFDGFLKTHAPWLYHYLLPEWVAERCPMPSLDLQVIRASDRWLRVAG